MELISLILKEQTLTPLEKIVVIYLSAAQSGYASQVEISKALGVSLRTVERTFNRLRHMNVIHSNGKQYALSQPTAWRLVRSTAS